MILTIIFWVLVGIGCFMSYGIGLWVYDRIDTYYEKKRLTPPKDPV